MLTELGVSMEHRAYDIAYRYRATVISDSSMAKQQCIQCIAGMPDDHWPDPTNGACFET